MKPSSDYIDPRDRTRDWLKLIEVYKRSLPYQPVQPNKVQSSNNDFTKAASFISRQIDTIEQKLEKLKTYAKKQSLFDDPALGISKLTRQIKDDISKRTSEIEMLNQTIGKGMPRKSINRQLHKNYSSMIEDLKKRLANNTKKFQEILQLRNQNIKQNLHRKTNFESQIPQSGLRKRNPNAFSRFNFDTNVEPNGMVNQEALLQEQEQLEEKSQYLSARVNAVENIESTIADLGQMYTKMATMLTTQGETIIRIDSSLDDAQLYAEAGHEQLTEMYDRSKNEWKLIVKIFAIIIAISMFFIFFYRR